MWQLYRYWPAVGNVRAMVSFADGVVMFAGAPGGALSKKTLCCTAPKSNVTVPPAVSSTVAGVN